LKIKYYNKDYTIENYHYSIHLENQILSISKNIEKIFEKTVDSKKSKITYPQEKLLYIGSVIEVAYKSTDPRYLIVILVSIIELILTRNPDSSRYNVEDSISKQFLIKVSVLLYKYDNSIDLDNLKKDLKDIYNIRSKIAHGDFIILHEELKKISAKSNNDNIVYQEIISKLYKYVAIIIKSYIEDPVYIDYLKEI
jgi:hypothetical protein